MRIALSLIFALLGLIRGNSVLAQGNFVKIELPHKVSIQIPKNWVVFSNNERITLDAAVDSRLDLSNIEYGISKLPFAANLYDDLGNTIGILNIRYYPNIELTQEDIELATYQETQEIDKILRTSIKNALDASSIELLYWYGTQKATINNITIFITEYYRKSIKDNGSFRVRLVRVIAGSKSFTLTVSYKISNAYLLKPITDRVISSLSTERL